MSLLDCEKTHIKVFVFTPTGIFYTEYLETIHIRNDLLKPGEALFKMREELINKLKLSAYYNNYNLVVTDPIIGAPIMIPYNS